MKLIGMMPVRNEAWCLGLSARVALMWCDELVILLHACTDDSPQIALDLAREFNPRVIAVVDKNECWDEMRHRQAVLEIARAAGATHLAIIDADEVLTGDLLPDRHGLRNNQGSSWGWYPRVSPGHILQLPGYNIRGELINRYHDNGIWGNRWFSTIFRDEPCLGWQGDKFHSREPVCLLRSKEVPPLAPYRPIAQGQGGVMHLWGASERRLRAKHAWYKVTERLRWPEKLVDGIDQKYSLSIKGAPWDDAAGTPDTWTYSPVPASWWAPYEHLMQYLDVDAEPWQETEVKRLVAEHGMERFRGLDLFGVG